MAQAIASIGMATVIWFVQIVHYPLMAAVGSEHLPAYALKNRELTTWIVLPLMALEVFSALALLGVPLSPKSRTRHLVGLLLLLIVWGVTFFVSVPHHLELSERDSPAALSGLVQSNWIRTVAWSVRAWLAVWLLWEWGSASNLVPPCLTTGEGESDA